MGHNCVGQAIQLAMRSNLIVPNKKFRSRVDLTGPALPSLILIIQTKPKRSLLLLIKTQLFFSKSSLSLSHFKQTKLDQRQSETMSSSGSSRGDHIAPELDASKVEKGLFHQAKQGKITMVLAFDDSEHSFYALEWTLNHFYSPATGGGMGFQLVIVHAKRVMSAVNVSGPGTSELLYLRVLQILLFIFLYVYCFEGGGTQLSPSWR